MSTLHPSPFCLIYSFKNCISLSVITRVQIKKKRNYWHSSQNWKKIIVKYKNTKDLNSKSKTKQNKQNNNNKNLRRTKKAEKHHNLWFKTYNRAIATKTAELHKNRCNDQGKTEARMKPTTYSQLTQQRCRNLVGKRTDFTNDVGKQDAHMLKTEPRHSVPPCIQSSPAHQRPYYTRENWNYWRKTWGRGQFRILVQRILFLARIPALETKAKFDKWVLWK